MDEQGDQGSTHTPVIQSGFPSPQSTAPSPRIPPVQNFIQPLQSPSPAPVWGDSETHHRHSSSHSGQLRLSPNHLENSRQRSLSRRSMEEGLKDEDEPMQRESSRPPQAPSPRFSKEDTRLRDLGASLQKSLSFNGDDELQEMQRDDERYMNLGRNPIVRHHPYKARPRAEPSSQRPQRPAHVVDNLIRDRRGKNRVVEEDREIMGKTPVLLNSINTSQTNILSELQTLQRLNQEELAHFREELYASLQLAFTRIADQMEGVGRAVVAIENSQKEQIQRLALSIGATMGENFNNMTESLQQQIQMQGQSRIQQGRQPYQASCSRPSSIAGLPTSSGSRQAPFGGSGNNSWRRSDPNPAGDYDDDGKDDEEEEYGR
ncbi:hypothetical protein BGZ65_006762, partial [Modicella reniformis]